MSRMTCRSISSSWMTVTVLGESATGRSVRVAVEVTAGRTTGSCAIASRVMAVHMIPRSHIFFMLAFFLS